MNRTDASAWRKSSYSSGAGDNCVEVADNIPGTVPVRDSKNPTGPALAFGIDAWAAFVGTFKRED
ncbi:DUF397 domain-containing protein [Streptomyces sp. NPDC020412]|uniref:DUF397 domain-containing protein n=1 Tax=Streptomyces sp. NPDC020412 TaxID=3365073 RepID=UPI003787F180